MPTKDDVASAGLPASKQSPLLFGNLPVTLFTFIASLSRCAPFRGDICASGLLSACVDRFVLEMGDPNVDIKVRWRERLSALVWIKGCALRRSSLSVLPISDSLHLRVVVALRTVSCVSMCWLAVTYGTLACVVQVQAELAILFARVASRAFPGFGAANDTILGKQRTCNPETLAK